MSKTLEIGKDYGDIMGLDASRGQTMVYNGGISWTGSNGKQSHTMDSQAQTDRVIEYINRPSTCMGRLA